MRYLALILFSSILFLTSCQSKAPTYGDVLSASFDQKLYQDFDSAAYFVAIQKELKNENANLFNPKWMIEIADSAKGFNWIQHQLLTGGTDSLLNYLNRADEHGINPSFFHTAKIQQALDQLKSKQVADLNEAYTLLAKVEILSSDAMVAYVNMLENGIVNPKRLYGRYFVAHSRYTLPKVRKLLDSTLNVSEVLQHAQPKNSFYKKFQQLLAKGNLTKDDRTKVLLTMERLRWMGKDFPEKYVFVNIPEMKLQMIDEGTLFNSMNVCVGETENKAYTTNSENHETPIMSGILDRMQVNPVWNIPQSIVKKELLASVRANPGYLESRNMVVYNLKGQLVNPYNINWQADSVKNFKFKQNPGYDNSLGNIKFIFANPYAIYLHDTPAKGKFKASNRAVSHGCVRVENPTDLASFLVNNEKEAAKIASEIKGSSNDSRWVKMKEGIPVYLSYYTTWLNENKEIQQFPDIYGYDQRLKLAMKKYL
ncbi:L,D-transpeptidase family protein [Sphingobacterium sp. SRCM116780]|uniref:L,D-transpeptidase family protein n=1 Tax=Sphingobacterium sp. SRCM116780 TaxID=2907623 RepID=UPI001EFFF268|nr:L,D-transpeptidase family protein [Sphingobacterium sp. SRCM116780]UIR56778.1 L,D-transpeptidase family protein [Sphingobacterium sp. SRCM116780]